MSIRDLEPESVWSRFFFVCGIPHPSHHEKALALALAERARARGFFAIEGEGGNLVIRKPASPGREGSAGIILQAHLDMVPQSAAGSSHNFLRDPIRPRIDPQDPAWLIADGTTLGADNGIGLAMALSVLEEPGLPHGPLECLFTVNEEDGMTGARRVEPGILKGSILLNLDGEDDAELTIGCAGSIRTSCRFSIPAERAPGGLEWFDVSVEGLAGGHSGIDIGKGRANAALVLARLLSRTGSGFLIASIEAGSAANAIPRSAAARIGLAPGGTKAFRAVFRREAALLRAELGTGDPGLKTAFKPPPGPPPKYALGAGDGARMLALLASLPNGSRATEPGLP
ncbi:MAG TPA: M20/M25/M40 family metallo-hydrolase, partial [Magnetospirillaceae bacterium]|nr:M20/M25/M40 family metallo-hydrolase [Magnetospirillaceae bacterium]